MRAKTELAKVSRVSERYCLPCNKPYQKSRNTAIDGCSPEMASATNSDLAGGPVLTYINKRIRSLEKKLNRIVKLEDSIAQGNSIIKLNKDQENLLQSKLIIIAVIDELYKSLRPLSIAVDEEITLALQHPDNRYQDFKKAQTLDEDEEQQADCPVTSVEDLLSLIYFGRMFGMMEVDLLSRGDERSCCIAFSNLDEDTLGGEHLDTISMLSSLMISRPVDSSLISHQDALQRCIQHANHWISKSNKQIHPDTKFTYADVKKMVTKIMGLDYFKETPSDGLCKYPKYKLMKKLKLIGQLEDMAQGPPIIKLNKYQEELVKSKPSILAMIDELDKSRQPEQQQAAFPVEDMLTLIYLGNMFDIKPVDLDYRWVERGWCLGHDACRHHPGVKLGDEHLDAISMLSSLMISRPVNSSLISHQDALKRCIEHANRWISKSKKQIHPDTKFTYADVREMLTKVMGLDYFKHTPSAEHPKYILISEEELNARFQYKEKEEEPESWKYSDDIYNYGEFPLWDYNGDSD